jgi:hypothetical protein
MELIVTANNASRSSGMISFGTFVNDLSDVGGYLRETYDALTKRMKEPEVQSTIEKLLGIHGRLPGLDGLLVWLDRINGQSNKAIKDLEYLRGEFKYSRFSSSANGALMRF